MERSPVVLALCAGTLAAAVVVTSLVTRAADDDGRASLVRRARALAVAMRREVVRAGDVAPFLPPGASPSERGLQGAIQPLRRSPAVVARADVSGAEGSTVFLLTDSQGRVRGTHDLSWVRRDGAWHLALR
jgi:hypothetical protein